MDHLLATLANGWTAFSVIATLGGLSGILLIAAALILGAYLPAGLRHLLVGIGACVLVGSALFQAGQARGAHQQLERDAARAVQAEKDRAAAAERVSASVASQAAKDKVAAQADKAQLKELLDVAQKRADARRVCVDRDLSRRLRAL